MVSEDDAAFTVGDRFEIEAVDPSTDRYVAYDEIEDVVTVGLEGKLGYRLRSYGVNDQPIRAHVVAESDVQRAIDTGQITPMDEA